MALYQKKGTLLDLHTNMSRQETLAAHWHLLLQATCSGTYSPEHVSWKWSWDLESSLLYSTES
nr:hypothetical protein Iba_chr06cCG3890 [Ipomoea batatas]